MIENRRLTTEEERLLRWMLVQGGTAARALLPQVDRASVTPVCCPCGCPSLQLQIEGQAPPTGGMKVVADFHYGEGEHVSGIFAYERDGFLAGLEVYAWPMTFRSRSRARRICIPRNRPRFKRLLQPTFRRVSSATGKRNIPRAPEARERTLSTRFPL
ncbi:MAG TPA: hypothetical protein VF665_17205 [Longimicrobium sp.]|uniref:hypothetical protein n=1 Tax=Longimicrobium sp. TaxID=2029185 RepID=UPI002ED7F42E